MPTASKSNNDAVRRRPSATCYPLLVELFKAGFAVEFRPKPGTDDVTMTVSEAKNGNVEGCEVDLCGMEWLFAEEGIAERLREAAETLLDNIPTMEREASSCVNCSES